MCQPARIRARAKPAPLDSMPWPASPPMVTLRSTDVGVIALQDDRGPGKYATVAALGEWAMAGEQVIEREAGGAPAAGSGWRQAAVDRITGAILGNRLRHDGTELRFEPAGARRLAGEIVDHFLRADPQDYPLILDAAGFKFVL